jgi:formylglycine-generating enzyme required for sulfatase activity
MPKPLKIFVAYSKTDEVLLDELLNFLKGLEQEDVEFWTDRKILGGEVRDEVIERNVREAAIVLVLVSQDLLDSADFNKAQIERFLAQQKYLFPIMLSSCEWEWHDWLKSRRFLPGNHETVKRNYTDPGRRDELFLEIRKQLRELIERVRAGASNTPHNPVVDIEVNDPGARKSVIDGITRPVWAKAIERDKYGLYADLRIGPVYQRMRWIMPGDFIMGSPENEAERFDNETQHWVILSRGFWLADTAGTQLLWQAVMGSNPSHFKGENRPVEMVSWDEVQRFIERLNRLIPGGEFRLPTEAEWEYACRAGTTTAFWFGDQITPEQVNYFGRETVEVKALPCNNWGLYQMHGNVWEWCQDGYAAYPPGAATDPAGPAVGGRRVLRGGGWAGVGRLARSASRFHDAPASRFDFLGFRLARGQASGPG